MKEKVNRSYKKPNLALICPPSFLHKAHPIQALTQGLLFYEEDNVKIQKDQIEDKYAISQSQWNSKAATITNQSARMIKTRTNARSLKPKRNSEFRKTQNKNSPYIKDHIKFKNLLQSMKPIKAPTISILNQIDKYNQMNRLNAENVIMKKKESFNIKMSKYSCRIGLKNNQKLFIFNSKDHHIRQILRQNGWVESMDQQSAFFYLKWVYLDTPSDYDNLKEGQFYNHFRGNQQLTNKNMLKKNIKKWRGPKPNFPLTYDLMSFEEDMQFHKHYQNFVLSKFMNEIITAFRTSHLSYYEKVLNNKYNFHQYKHASKSIFQKKCNIKILIQLLMPQKLKKLKQSNQPILEVRKILYQFCSEYYLKNSQTKFSMVSNKTKKDSKLWEKMQKIKRIPAYRSYVQQILQYDSFIAVQIIKVFDNMKKMHNNCYGFENSWIVKPVGVSRGSGITISTDLMKLTASKYGKIVQKYIEKPLLLKCGRKFDIRQWVLVKSFSPLQAYVFQKCYCRFSFQKYEESKFENLKMHLTNFSKNKFSFNMVSQCKQSTMSQEQVAQQIGDKWDSLKKKMNYQILKTLKCCQYEITQRQQSFEVFGFDILIDSNYQPWIIEVNMSPACENRNEFLDDYLKKMSKGIYNLVNRQKIQNWIQLEDNLIQTQNLRQKNDASIISQRWWRKYQKKKKSSILYK